MTQEVHLPVVHLDDKEASTTAVQACRKYGFFILENHGVPVEQLQAVFAQSKAFFDLSAEQKATCLANKDNRGFTPMHDETLDPASSSQGDTKEGYYIFEDIEPDSEAASRPLHGPNVWPAEDLLPGWKHTMLSYYETMMSVGRRTARLLAEGSGLEPDFFDQHLTNSMSALRLLHYSDAVSDPGTGIFGAGAHSDYGLLTFLATDGVPGLQILMDGAWMDVPPQPGAFIVNLGDMLQRWTNDQFKSTVHRVINRVGRDRYSIPFFFEPNFDTRVEVLAPFISPDCPAKYEPILSGQHLMDKYSATHKHYEATRLATAAS